MTEIWQPDPTDIYMAQEGYLRYAAGIAILNNPSRTQELHRHDPYHPEQRESLLIHAQTLMWDGLINVIRYSNPPDSRAPLRKTEKRHDQALPIMLAIVDDMAEKRTDQLRRLNTFLPVMRPLPLTHEPTYRAVAHQDKSQVTLAETMDAFTIDASFGGDAVELTYRRVSLSSTAPHKGTTSRDELAKAGTKIVKTHNRGVRDSKLLNEVFKTAFSEGPLPDDK